MQETYDGIWREIAGAMRLHLSADVFQRWFAAIELVQADEYALTFQVPNWIYQFWIERSYLNVVQSAVCSMAGSRSCFPAIVRQARSPTWSNVLFRAWSAD